ncbi:non-homologous end-joining DNA ligase [Pelosinus propionicus]|uniref:Bifunctional non-homologous end joining protein LigD n=1 Tax=Pelosinus propionicus DSM 13327 TaxID=1123291 RepID=A0A1I4GV83_9FIRM|nr:non-homologous end-joining DNA ligase [Pelosinus propionicus]SFL33247.1 bifunctional non-homologous end joining protein LigD [Pelosinus propionicus DSM 13327]
MPNQTVMEINKLNVALSNLDKVFYTASNFTKAQVIDYYIRIAPVLLPHLTGRPLTLKRYPNGATAKFFYQKECPSFRPNWLSTVPVWSESKKRSINFCLAQDLPSLIWAVNLAAIELHTSLSRSDDILRPTMLVFDLDPGHPATIVHCAEVALMLHKILLESNLKSFPKTSGSKGMQIYIPLNTQTITYTQTKEFAHILAKTLEQQNPSLVVSKMKKDLRKGKIFIDWSQNDDHKTTVCVYSLRAKKYPTVSTPVTWEEVKTAYLQQAPDQLSFTTNQVLDRVQKMGDLFAPVLELQQTLPNFKNKKMV